VRRLPKKPRYREFQKLRHKVNWFNGELGKWLGGIILLTRCKLFWRHFEMIRLRLAWGLGRRRRMSKKERFKKKVVKIQIKKYFKRIKGIKHLKRKFWYTGFPHLLISRRSVGGRMGKGKGNVKTWYFIGYEGHYLLVISGVRPISMLRVLKQITLRLPARSQVVVRCNSFINTGCKNLFLGSGIWK